MDSGLRYDRARLVDICERYQVSRLELFGSHARGEAGEGSDVDVLVTFRADAELGLAYFGFAIELEELFGRRVDVVERPVVERDRNPYFRRSVLRDVETLYAA